MEPYAHIPDAGPFAASADLFTTLVAELEGPAAAGLSTDRGKVETLRAKLKRLAERGWLAEEAGPGLFGLPAQAGNGAGEAAKPG